MIRVGVVVAASVTGLVVVRPQVRTCTLDLLVVVVLVAALCVVLVVILLVFVLIVTVAVVVVVVVVVVVDRLTDVLSVVDTGRVERRVVLIVAVVARVVGSSSGTRVVVTVDAARASDDNADWDVA